jgi:subtilisin family serine protease
MATPHVAGVAALLISQGVTNPAAVEALLKATALDLGAAGRDDEYGHGLIQPRTAIRGYGIFTR